MTGRPAPPGGDTAPFPANQFPYLVLADRLTARIKAGEFSGQQKLPTRRELMAHYRCGQGTVRHAWQELQERGLIYNVQGLGMFVA